MQSSVQIDQLLSAWDYAVISVVMLLTIVAVVVGHQLRPVASKLENEQELSILDHLIMGRQLTLPLFVATLVATWYGGIFGVTRIAFEKGIFNFITQGVFWYVAYIIFALFLVNRITPYQAVTLPDLINKMFGPKSAKLSALFNFFNVLPIVYTISIGLLLQMLFHGPLWLMMAIGVGIVIIYSLFGGFRAVVFSDLVQFFVMCSGVLLVALLSYLRWGGEDFLVANLPASHFTLTGGEGIATTLVWGFIALSTLVDPNFYQRVFAAKSPQVAKRGILISTLIWVVFDICTTAGAMYARAVIPDATSEHAYLIYSVQLLPHGLRGFFIAGIIATILSTLDSYLFLAGATISYDLTPKRFRNHLVIQQTGIVLVGILSGVVALLFDGNIRVVWKTLGSYSAACLLLPVVLGQLLPNRISDRQFFMSSILGVVVTTYWYWAPRVGFWKSVDEIYVGALATLVGLLIFSKLSD